jgi:phosphate transport system permease protein
MRLAYYVKRLIATPDSSASRLGKQKIGFSCLFLLTLFTVIPIIAVVFFILLKGLPAFSWTFLTTFPTDGVKQGGILPAIVGTLLLTIGTAVFSVPLGIGAAIRP